MCGAGGVFPGLYWSKLLSVSCAPPPSEPGRRWIRSHPQQQVLCFQNCQQRQFLSLQYQWKESYIQRCGGSIAKSWHWPRPQQIPDLTGNWLLFFFFFFVCYVFIISFLFHIAFYSCCVHLIQSKLCCSALSAHLPTLFQSNVAWSVNGNNLLHWNGKEMMCILSALRLL